jgi:hypothetical protein
MTIAMTANDHFPNCSFKAIAIAYLFAFFFGQHIFIQEIFGVRLVDITLIGILSKYHKDNLQQCYRTFFSKSVFKLDISGFQSWSKNAKLLENFFLLNVCGFFREKNSQILAWMDRFVVTWFTQ